jgi:Ca2+-transporting ATPase
MRNVGQSFWKNDVTQNRFVWGALALCLALILLAVYVPGLSDILKLAPPGRVGWMLALSMSLVPVLLGVIAHTVDLNAPNRHKPKQVQRR